MKKDIEVILKGISLVDSVTVTVANLTKYDDNQVEIRDSKTGQLIWRSWDFQPGFMEDFKRELERYKI